MNKGIAIVLFCVGMLLIGWGVAASDSVGSDFSRFFTGMPTEKAVWSLIAGVLLGVTGLYGLMGGSKSN